MKNSINLLSKVLMFLHYPADLGGFVLFYLLLRNFSNLDFIPMLALTLCLGAGATLLSGIFYALWTSEHSPRYMLYGRRTVQVLEAISFAVMTLPVLSAFATAPPGNFWAALSRYFIIGAALSIVRFAGVIILLVMLVKIKDWEAHMPIPADPKPTLAEIVASMQQAAEPLRRQRPLTA